MNTDTQGSLGSVPAAAITLFALLLGMAAADGVSAAKTGDVAVELSGGKGGVNVRVVDKTYPVMVDGRARITPKFVRREYTTKLVILENEYLEVHVLPEFGGRLVRAVYRPAQEQMFWEYDILKDTCSWSMGGGRWSFPYWEHGRHMDETGGYTIVRHEDGSVTLAVDMRFEDYLKWSETGRYGRATNLRLVQLINLRPGEALFTWTGRVDNPLPIRYGFKLWWLLRQPAVEGTRVILPAAGVTGHKAPNLYAWDRSATITEGMRVKSVFAIGMRHGFAGWHFPRRDFSVLRVLDPTTAPGAKQVLYGAHPEGYIEMWGGNNEVFEECGRMLPAFGGYQIEMKVLPSKGTGLPEFANEHGAIALSRTNNNWTVTLAPTRKLNGARMRVESGANVAEALVSASPDKPVSWRTGITNESFLLRLRDDNGNLLMEQALPVDVGPLPQEEFRAVQERTRTKTRGRRGETLTIMPGGALLHAEATDLLSEHQLNLPRAKRRLYSLLGRTRDRVELLDTTRRIMRLHSQSTNVLAGIERILDAHPEDPHANLYKAMWLIEADRDGEAGTFLARAQSLPGGRYLLALDAMSRKQYRAVVEHIRQLLAMGPEQTFWGREDHALGLLQPGCFIAATRPKLLLALAFEAQGKPGEARTVLDQLVRDDPACIEAWMLLKDEARVSTLTERNASGKRAAEITIEALRAGQWRGIGRPR